MNVESICSRHIVALDATDNLQRAAGLMREHHVGSVVVTRTHEGGTQVVGLVTDRDLAIEVLARGGDVASVALGHLVQGPPIGVPATAELADAVRAMEAHAVRRLLVHDAEGHLVGILTVDDLLPALAEPLAGLAEVLRRGFAWEASRRGTIAAPERPVLRVPAMGTSGWQQPMPVG